MSSRKPKSNCPTGKRGYPSDLEAKIQLSNIHSSRAHHRHQTAQDEPVRTYPCDRCGLHHLTSQPRRSDHAD